MRRRRYICTLISNQRCTHAYLNHIHPAGDATEHRVLVVQPRGWHCRDEKLGPVCCRPCTDVVNGDIRIKQRERCRGMIVVKERDKPGYRRRLEGYRWVSYASTVITVLRLAAKRRRKKQKNRDNLWLGKKMVAGCRLATKSALANDTRTTLNLCSCDGKRVHLLHTCLEGPENISQ